MLRLADGDLYKEAFMRGHDRPQSWATFSLALLCKWELVDITDFDTDIILSSYFAYVVDTLMQRCGDFGNRRSRGSTLTLHHSGICSAPSTLLNEALHVPLQWLALIAMRSWCRLRLGIIALSHRGGKRSSAR